MRERDGRARRGPRGIPLSTVWVCLSFALPLSFVVATPLSSVDLAYVVRAGRDMLETGDLFRADAFLFTAWCDPWHNQQWGAEVLLGGVFGGLGWLGLALARAALTAGVLAFVHGAARAWGAQRRAAAFVTLLSGTLLLSGLHLRAQLLGLLFFAATLWIVARRGEHPAWVFLAAPITVLWANTHGSFPLGLLLLAVAWLEDRVNARPSGRTLAAAVLSLAATALTPFGPSVWSYVVELSTNPVIRRVVQEWRPPGLGTYSGIAFFASVAFAAVVFVRNRRELPWPTWIQLAVLLALAMFSTRAVFWWGLALPVTLARLPWARRSPAEDLRHPANAALAGVLLVLPIIAIVRWLPYPGETPPSNLVAYAPIALTSELERILEPGEPFVNPQAWGSWFELSLPGHPLFVDSRFEVMPASTLEANGRITRAEAGWEEELGALPVRIVVVDRETQPALVEGLASADGWIEEYADGEGLVFVREGAAPAAPMPECEDAPGER